MTRFPDDDQVRRALVRTHEALNIDAASSLGMNEAGVLIKYLLLTGLAGDDIRDRRAERQAANFLTQRLDKLLDDLWDSVRAGMVCDRLPGIDWAALDFLLTGSPYYRQRLLDLSLEAVLSEPLAPELCLKFSPFLSDELSAALPGAWNHAVIFESPVCFTHELYPLVVDAWVHDAERYGESRINVLGVHTDWLTEFGAFRRMIYLDMRTGRFVETDLVDPIRPSSVHFLCLGSAEQERHAALSRMFKCRQVNPIGQSGFADDKAVTLSGWSARGLDTPASRIVVSGNYTSALRFLENFKEVVVKPNKASEGKLVAYFQNSDPDAQASLARHLEYCWALGDALIQQRRDGIFFRNPVSSAQQTLALRLNMAFDGRRHRLASGFAQLGRDAQSPASCTRSGQLVSIDHAFSGLVFGNAREGKPVRLDYSDWSRIRMQAEQAAALFDDLMLVGLDVLLDIDRDGNIAPVFLEANPRPAGLSHSRLCADDPSAPSPIGVSLELWSAMGTTRR